jgi:hypothetical protein
LARAPPYEMKSLKLAQVTLAIFLPGGPIVPPLP